MTAHRAIDIRTYQWNNGFIQAGASTERPTLTIDSVTLTHACASINPILTISALNIYHIRLLEKIYKHRHFQSKMALFKHTLRSTNSAFNMHLT